MDGLDTARLNESLYREYFVLAAYEIAIGTQLLAPSAAELIRTSQRHHRLHAATLLRLIEKARGGAEPALTLADMSDEFPPVRSQEDVLQYAVSLEQRNTRDHYATVSALGDQHGAALVASVADASKARWLQLVEFTRGLGRNST